MRFAPLSVTVIDCGDPAAVAPTRLELEELMAPNGAGPTATLRLLAGSIRERAGRECQGAKPMR